MIELPFTIRPLVKLEPAGPLCFPGGCLVPMGAGVQVRSALLVEPIVPVFANLDAARREGWNLLEV